MSKTNESLRIIALASAAVYAGCNCAQPQPSTPTLDPILRKEVVTIAEDVSRKTSEEVAIRVSRKTSEEISIRIAEETVKKFITQLPPGKGVPPAYCPKQERPGCKSPRDARICYHVGDRSTATFTKQGLCAFVTVFEAAAARGVENATMRAFNSKQECPASNNNDDGTDKPSQRSEDKFPRISALQIKAD